MSFKLVFDSETSGLDSWGTFEERGYHPDRPFAFAFLDLKRTPLYYRFDVDPFTRRVEYEKQPETYARLKKLFEAPGLELIGHNICFDVDMIRKAGFNFQGKMWDTKILAHIANSSRPNFKLKPLTQTMFNYPVEDQEDLQKSVVEARRKGKKLGWKLANKDTHGKEPVKADFWMGDPELCKKYAMGDVERTLRLWEAYSPLLTEPQPVWSPYIKYAEIAQREHDLLPIVMEMTAEGATIDMAKVDELEAYYTKCMETSTQGKVDEGFADLNAKSSKQVIDVMYTQLGATPVYRKRKNKKTGKSVKTLSVDKKVLASLSHNIPLAQHLLEYSEAQKQLTGFIRPFRARSFMQNGSRTIHTGYNTVGPITGRMSAGYPINMQNITSPDSAGKLSNVEFRVREVFVPPPGFVWLLADYAQIEIYCTAYLSGDKAMIGALERGEKLHDVTCKNVLGGIPGSPDWETKRKKAKITNFLLQYMGTAPVLAQTLGISIDEADVIVAKYWETYHGLAEFYERLEKEYKTNGFVTNLFGRSYRVDLPRFAYKLGNYVSQGTAADIIKEAMIALHKFLEAKFQRSKLILQVHDELIQKTPVELLCPELVQGTIKCMQGNFGEMLGMPGSLPVEASVARINWSAKEKWEPKQPIELKDWIKDAA